MNPQVFPLCGNLGGAFRPNQPYRFEPLMELFSKFPRPYVFDGPELLYKSKWPEDRYPLRPFRGKASVRQPHEQIEDSRRRCKKSHRFEVGWNGMRGDLLKKFIAQDDNVLIRLAKQTVLVSAVVPDPSFSRWQRKSPGRMTKANGRVARIGTAS